MFIDASALAAILLAEEDAFLLNEAIDEADAPFTSPIAVFETVLAVNRRRAGGVERVHSSVLRFLDRAGIAIRPIESGIAERALSAFARYGKGQGHPAQLNLGDCFAYAMAQAHGVGLLYKGGDFALTDLG